LLVADEQIVVAAIRFPGDVREVPDNRDCAENIFNRQVQHHAEDCDARGTAFPRRCNDEHRGECGKGVAYARDPANQSIQAETDSCSRDFESIIQPSRNVVEVLIRGDACRFVFRDIDRLRKGRKDVSSNVGGSGHVRRLDDLARRLVVSAFRNWDGR